MVQSVQFSVSNCGSGESQPLHDGLSRRDGFDDISLGIKQPGRVGVHQIVMQEAAERRPIAMEHRLLEGFHRGRYLLRSRGIRFRRSQRERSNKRQKYGSHCVLQEWDSIRHNIIIRQRLKIMKNDPASSHCESLIDSFRNAIDLIRVLRLQHILWRHRPAIPDFPSREKRGERFNSLLGR
jgi:hypothetical protein